MSGQKKITLKSLSEELETVKEQAKEIPLLKNEIAELKKIVEMLTSKDSVSSTNKGAEMMDTDRKEFKCKKCDFSSLSSISFKKHLVAQHQTKIECAHCDKTFLHNHELETHIEEHKIQKSFSCEVCQKDFYLQWRLEKHKNMHEETTKLCHFFTNKKLCPFDRIGCKFRHEEPKKASKSVEKNSNETNQKNDEEKKSEQIESVKKKQNEKGEKESVQSVILGAFEEDSRHHYSVNKECGLNNESQKCGRCKFITHSMGILRMHEQKTHKVYHNFDKVVDGFMFDDKKYYGVLSAMYDGAEQNRNKCEHCTFKTHSIGLLRMHETNSH